MYNQLTTCLNVLAERGIPVNGEIIKTLAYFADAQTAAGVIGNIAEIGVAKGAFLIPLAACRREGEAVFAIDVFDDGPNWNPSGGVSSLVRLKETVDAALGGAAAVHYLSSDSLHLGSRELLAAAGGKFRLFSIDGAHSSKHTVNDLMLAGEVLTSGGLVWLDDIRNWGWPGVIDGFARYMLLNATTRLAPFFLYSNKLLLTTPDRHQIFLDKATELAHAYGRKAEVSYRISDFFGHRVVGWN
jgi:hypothetical protein